MRQNRIAREAGIFGPALVRTSTQYPSPYNGPEGLAGYGLEGLDGVTAPDAFGARFYVNSGNQMIPDGAWVPDYITFPTYASWATMKRAQGEWREDKPFVGLPPWASQWIGETEYYGVLPIVDHEAHIDDPFPAAAVPNVLSPLFHPAGVYQPGVDHPSGVFTPATDEDGDIVGVIPTNVPTSTTPDASAAPLFAGLGSTGILALAGVAAWWVFGRAKRGRR